MGRAGPVPLSSHCSAHSHAQVDMAGAAEDVSMCPPCLIARGWQPNLPQTVCPSLKLHGGQVMVLGQQQCAQGSLAHGPAPLLALEQEQTKMGLQSM